MATKERQKRINAAISETKRQLIKAKKGWMILKKY